MLNAFQKKVFPKKSLKKPSFAAIPVSEKPSIILIYEHCTYSTPKKKSGRATLAYCPFHDDIKTSLALYEDTQSAFCFGCGWKGDGYEFVKKSMGTDFKTAKMIIEGWGL